MKSILIFALFCATTALAQYNDPSESMDQMRQRMQQQQELERQGRAIDAAKRQAALAREQAAIAAEESRQVRLQLEAINARAEAERQAAIAAEKQRKREEYAAWIKARQEAEARRQQAIIANERAARIQASYTPRDPALRPPVAKRVLSDGRVKVVLAGKVHEFADEAAADAFITGSAAPPPAR